MANLSMTVGMVTRPTISSSPNVGVADGIAYIKLGSSNLPPSNINSYKLLIVGRSGIAAAVAEVPPAVFYTSPQVSLAGGATIQISYDQASANNWLLRNAGGTWMKTAFNQYLLDPGIQAARVAFADSVLAEITSTGADGIFHDDIQGYWAGFQGDFSTATPSKANGSAYTQAEWETAVVGWCQYVGTRVKQAGKHMIFNATKFISGVGTSDTGEMVRDFWTAIGGACCTHLCDEYWVCLQDGARRPAGPAWFENWVGWQSLVAHTHTLGTSFIGLEAGAASSAVYGRASALLDWQPGDLFMREEPTEPWDPSWTKNLGAASGAKYQVGNEWRRDFANGVAKVDPVAVTATVG